MNNHQQTKLEELTELALKHNPYGYVELLKENSPDCFDDEKAFAEKFYSDPTDYNPEIGLDVALMDEDMLKDAILMLINDCENSEENGIHTSLEDAEKLLNKGILSSTAIENLKDKLAQTVKALENQEVTLNAQDMEKLFGLDLALSTFSHSMA